MQILKANIGLQKIEGARVAKDKTGVDCVIIPVKAANIFVSDKGGIYLNVDIIEGKNGEDPYGNTHMITLDIGKDRRSAGEKGAILGNCKTLTFGSTSAPSTQRQAPPAAKSGGQQKDASWIDDDDEPAF